MTGPAQDGGITVAAGPVSVLHRLALAVRPVDARTNGSAYGVRVGRETGAPAGRVLPLESHGATGAVLRYGEAGVRSRRVLVRLDDPARRWVPRRLTVPLWTRAEVAGADNRPPTLGYVPAPSRLLRPWLLPGPAYPVARGVTGIRLRVTYLGMPVRWPRVEAFGPGGLRVGYAHGDEYGQVLLLVESTGALPPPTPSTFPIALRSHIPDPALAAPTSGLDPLADLAVESIARSAAPPAPQDLDNEVLRGITPPPGYRTAAQDVIRTLTVGQLVLAADLPHV